MEGRDQGDGKEGQRKKGFTAILELVANDSKNGSRKQLHTFISNNKYRFCFSYRQLAGGLGVGQGRCYRYVLKSVREAQH